MVLLAEAGFSLFCAEGQSIYCCLEDRLWCLRIAQYRNHVVDTVHIIKSSSYRVWDVSTILGHLTALLLFL